MPGLSPLSATPSWACAGVAAQAAAPALLGTSVLGPGHLSSVSPEEPRTSTVTRPASSRAQGQKGERDWGQATSYPGRRVTGRGVSTRAMLPRTRGLRGGRGGARTLGSMALARASALALVQVWLCSHGPQRPAPRRKSTRAGRATCHPHCPQRGLLVKVR